MEMDFNDIKEAILENRVIAFLGHGLTVNHGDPGREHRFFEKLFEENRQEVKAYNPEDEFLTGVTQSK